MNFEDEELASREEGFKIWEEFDERFFKMKHKEISFPEPLKPGDKVAFLSPASAVKDEYVTGAMERFRERGYEPVLMPYALDHEDGSYAAPKTERLMDLLDALDDKEIKAIFCNRGGYGCVQLLANFPYGIIAKNPKWIIGFSDVSALIAMWYFSDLASIHGPMAKHLTTEPDDDPCTNALFRLLSSGGKFNYRFNSSPRNNIGKSKGILRGGNFAVLNGLAGTPFDILNIRDNEDVILFFEDISEPIYAVERMLQRLNLSGTLAKVKGLIFGRFTEYKADRNFRTMEDMIENMLSKAMMPDIPVVFDFPVGHVSENYPLTVGATVELEVEDDAVSLRTI